MISSYFVKSHFELINAKQYLSSGDDTYISNLLIFWNTVTQRTDGMLIFHIEARVCISKFWYFYCILFRAVF